MTAYGAVTSLRNTIDYILHSSHISHVDEPSLRCILLAYKELQPWQEFLERLDKTRKSKSRKKVNALDGRIKAKLWEFEDLLESNILSPPRRDLQRLRDDVNTFIHTLRDMEKEYIYELEHMAEDEDEEEEDISSAIGSSGGTKSKVFGLLNQFKQFKGYLMRKFFGKHVHALVGMAGIGKTTLAMEIYNDPEIMRNYECRAWVTVSRKPKLKQISRDILAQLCGTPLSEGDEEIDDDLKERLEGKKCLIVLDDVWEREVLDSLISSLPNIKMEYMEVLVTARERDVIANVTSTVFGGFIEEVAFLDKKASMDLLCSRVFGEETCPPELHKAATKIANNCEGLPLMIVTVAGILSVNPQNRDPRYWEDVAEKRNSVRGCI